MTWRRAIQAAHAEMASTLNQPASVVVVMAARVLCSTSCDVAWKNVWLSVRSIWTSVSRWVSAGVKLWLSTISACGACRCKLAVTTLRPAETYAVTG